MIGYVLSVLLLLMAIEFFALLPGMDEAAAAVKSTGGNLEMILDGICLVLAAGLLAVGGTRARRGDIRGRYAMLIGAAVELIVVLLWLGRVQKAEAVMVAIVPALLGVVVMVLLGTASVRAWAAQGVAPQHVSVHNRVSTRWNSLNRGEQWAWCLIIVALFVLLPYLSSSIPIIGSISTEPGTDFSISLFNAARIALIAIGLNVVVGQSGLLDLGYVGFFAIGAYVTALFTSPDSTINQHYPWLVCVPLAMGITMFFGLILGAPTLRLRGDYLAIVTLGFGEIVRLLADNVPQLQGQVGFQNIAGPSIKHDGKEIFVQVTHGRPFYWLTLGIIVIVLIFVGNLERSRVGRAWVAIREDEDAAEIMGVPTFRFKLWAFVVGAAIGGLSGAIFAGQIGFVNNQKFDPVTSILFLAAVVLGGAGNKVGVIVGAFLISYIPDRFTSIAEYKYLIFGLALIVLMIFRPQGLLGARQRLLAYGRKAYALVGARPEQQLDSGAGAFASDVKSGAMSGGGT